MADSTTIIKEEHMSEASAEHDYAAAANLSEEKPPLPEDTTAADTARYTKWITEYPGIFSLTTDDKSKPHMYCNFCGTSLAPKFLIDLKSHLKLRQHKRAVKLPRIEGLTTREAVVLTTIKQRYNWLDLILDGDNTRLICRYCSSQEGSKRRFTGVPKDISLKAGNRSAKLHGQTGGHLKAIKAAQGVDLTFEARIKRINRLVGQYPDELCLVTPAMAEADGVPELGNNLGCLLCKRVLRCVDLTNLINTGVSHVKTKRHQAEKEKRATAEAKAQSQQQTETGRELSPLRELPKRWHLYKMSDAEVREAAKVVKETKSSVRAVESNLKKLIQAQTGRTISAATLRTRYFRKYGESTPTSVSGVEFFVEEESLLIANLDLFREELTRGKSIRKGRSNNKLRREIREQQSGRPTMF